MNRWSAASLGMIATSVVVCANVLLACSTFTAEETLGGADGAGGSGDDGAGDAAAQGDSNPFADAGPLADSAPLVGCNGMPACERLVFVTNGRFTGALGGFARADGQCRGSADKSSLPIMHGRKWVAWLSAPGMPASGRLVPSTMRYKRSDGVSVAQSYAQLLTGALANPISVDENGGQASLPVWTASTSQGNALTATCNSWTDTIGLARTGDPDRDDGRWTDDTDASCSQTARLYCFEY